MSIIGEYTLQVAVKSADSAIATHIYVEREGGEAVATLTNCLARRALHRSFFIAGGYASLIITSKDLPASTLYTDPCPKPGDLIVRTTLLARFYLNSRTEFLFSGIVLPDKPVILHDLKQGDMPSYPKVCSALFGFDDAGKHSHDLAKKLIKKNLSALRATELLFLIDYMVGRVTAEGWQAKGSIEKVGDHIIVWMDNELFVLLMNKDDSLFGEEQYGKRLAFSLKTGSILSVLYIKTEAFQSKAKEIMALPESGFVSFSPLYTGLEPKIGLIIMPHLSRNFTVLHKECPSTMSSAALAALTIVSELHRLEIVHGNLTPDNFFVFDNGTIKLFPFFTATSLSNKSALDERPGTFSYISPEFATLWKEAGRLDIHPSYATGDLRAREAWALGLLLSFLFLGERPIRMMGKTAEVFVDELLAVKSGWFLTWAATRELPFCMEGFLLIINELLEPDPGKRLTVTEAFRRACLLQKPDPFVALDNVMPIQIHRGEKAIHIFMRGGMAAFYRTNLIRLPHVIQGHLRFFQALPWEVEEREEDVPVPTGEPQNKNLIYEEWRSGEAAIRFEPPLLFDKPLIVHDLEQTQPLVKEEKRLSADVADLLGFNNCENQALMIAHQYNNLTAQETWGMLQHMVTIVKTLEGEKGVIQEKALARTLLWQRSGPLVEFYILLNRKKRSNDEYVGSGSSKMITKAIRVHEAALVATAASVGPDMMQEFEIQRALSEKHPTILPPLAIVSYTNRKGEEKKRMILPLGAGNLWHYICEKKLSFAERRSIAIDMIRAVAGVHKEGRIHRDIKPENFIIFLKPSLQVKLTDFGGTYLRPSELGTTLAYLCPEGCSAYQEAKGAIEHKAYLSVDPQKGDIWSLGITLAALITGRFPTLDKNGNEIVNRILRLQKNWFLAWSAEEASSWGGFIPLVNAMLEERRSLDDCLREALAL